MSTRLWPAIATTILTGLGFAALKFVLIDDIALGFHQSNPDIPFAWLQAIVDACAAKGNIQEALSQGLAATLTLGILLAFLINAPLTGCLRLSPMFAWSSAGVAVAGAAYAADAAGIISFNPWIVALLVGASYGATCAVRGKSIPVLARATGWSSTAVGGMINASLVVGLLGGTILGMALSEFLGENPSIPYLAIVVIFAVATVCGTLVNAPEPPPIPFSTGLRDLAGGTLRLLHRHWALLAGGGLAWGVASAAGLAVLLDGIERLQLSETKAATIGIFPAIGAILGNLLSTRLERRYQVIGSYLLMAFTILIYPLVVTGWGTAAFTMVFVGFFFAAPSNVLDARFLAAAAAEGFAGRGGTVMSLVHNLFILGVGSTLAISLLVGFMSADIQFPVLAGITVLCALISVFAPLDSVHR